jgi:sugar O-acyltransferase (sialic acid O-acetyltransferase NeuD family)
MTKKIGIIGFGSFTREIICNIKNNFDIFVSKSFIPNIENIENIEKYYNCKFYELEKFDYKKYLALVTISDLELRHEIVNNLHFETQYYTYIDKNSHIMDTNNKIGKGSIICSGSILTTNISLGNFVHCNINTTIGHDTKIGNFSTISPGVNISGNCNINDFVYIGTNSSIKENVSICKNVIIGLNSGVVKNINNPGIYVGTPAIEK